MKNIKHSTITLFFSIIVFAVTSAFTLTPDNLNYAESDTSLSCSCCTCTSAGNCLEATHCGMTQCPDPSVCFISGDLCGPDPECGGDNQ